jgi:hypothetical protein
MTAECQRLVDAYVSWLKSRITVADLNGACEITTPFLDRHNDRLQIYVHRTSQGLRLTDDGYTIGDLESSGCHLDTSVRQRLLQTILNGFGVTLDEKDGELFVEASEHSFPQKKHALLQAMLAVHDMFLTAKQHVTRFFWEDVHQFLEANDVRFTPSVEFTGKTGFVHKFDFVIPRSRKEPERILKAINSPSRDTATSLIFAWTDSREARPAPSRAFAVLNDSEKPISQEIVSALSQYDIESIIWSKRNDFVPMLAA